MTFYGAEPLIVARLNQTVGSMTFDGITPKIMTIGEIENLEEEALFKPSLRVGFDGWSVVEDKGNLPQGWTRINQVWTVCVAARNVRLNLASLSANAARGEATSLVDATLDALDGYMLPEYGKLKLVSPARRGGIDKGYIYTFLSFALSFRRHRTCSWE